MTPNRHMRWSTAEAVGFEPTRHLPAPNGFQDRRLRPLSHASKGQCRAMGATLAAPGLRGLRIPHALVAREASPSSVYGASLLMTLGSESPSRVRIPQPPRSAILVARRC
jgi:hypothetical protein